MCYSYLKLVKIYCVGQMIEKNYSLQFKDYKCTIFDPSREQVFCVKMKNISFVVDWDM